MSAKTDGRQLHQFHHGVDRMLVTPHAPDDLARSIVGLLSDRAAREQLGEAGHAKSRASFTSEKVTDRVEHLYRSARAEKETGRRPAGALA